MKYKATDATSLLQVQIPEMLPQVLYTEHQTALGCKNILFKTCLQSALDKAIILCNKITRNMYTLNCVLLFVGLILKQQMKSKYALTTEQLSP